MKVELRLLAILSLLVFPFDVQGGVKSAPSVSNAQI